MTPHRTRVTDACNKILGLLSLSIYQSSLCLLQLLSNTEGLMVGFGSYEYFMGLGSRLQTQTTRC